MFDIPVTDQNSSVFVSEDRLVFMKNNRDYPSLSGSSYFESSYYSLHYYPKTKIKSKSEKKKSQTKAKKKKFHINRKKVMQKSLSLANLRQSQIFLAFYSISFPFGFPDNSAIQCLNSWLTKLRQNSLKFNYIWVAERQKNGTIHFHILMNKFINIRVSNYYMAKSIQTQIKNDKLFDLNFDYRNYNGVDVQRVRNVREVSKYLTKYITKNSENFNCRAWGSCQLTSKLFTKISDYFGSVIIDVQNFLNKSKSEFYYYNGEFCFIIWFNKLFKSKLINQLRAINQEIYNQFYYIS